LLFSYSLTWHWSVSVFCWHPEGCTFLSNMDIRPSPIAGTWYSGSHDELAQSVDRFLAEGSAQQPAGRLLGLVVPHAGHRYSGKVAGAAFRLARGLKPDIVAVVSPLHNPYPGPVVTTAHEAYATPLGEIPVDAGAQEALHAALYRLSGFGLLPVRRDREHSLEIELPFLQRVLGSFRLLPVMILDQQRETARAVGMALAEVLRGKQILLVASSDLSHFYPESIARSLDDEMLRRIAAFDPDSVMRAEEEEVGFACGRAAIAAVLWAARALGADGVTICAKDTSGSVTGDQSSVVGYGSAAIWQSAAA
jgi:MEMO1 family protein